jgi:trans-aconitate 2-methyltransferase
VYDLGCGPGNSTALLAEAYPNAEIVGVDSSAEMLAEGRRSLPSGRFVLEDLTRWLPDETPDLLFSNAALQWVPDHVTVLGRLVTKLPKGGVLAVQIPDNRGEPCHLLMEETARSGPWAEKLVNADGAREIIRAPGDYYDRLKPECSRLDIWLTVYYHPIEGASAIVDFLGSTALRPYLSRLDKPERMGFLADFTERLAQAYRTRADGMVLLPFPRLFLIAVR